MSDISSVEVTAAIENLNNIWDGFSKETKYNLDRLNTSLDAASITEQELRQEIEDLENDGTDMEIVCPSGRIDYKIEGNLWLEQIMENIEKIIQMKGEKYLLDRLDASVKQIQKVV